MAVPGRAERGGFTLIEVLVAVSVIGVLVALLLPALGGARGAAQMVMGASNVRQLQLANAVYAEDHDDAYMPGAVDFVGTNLHRWHGTRETRGEAFTGEGGPITAYLDDRGGHTGVRACPRFSPTLADRRTALEAFELGCGGYGYNNAFVGVRRERALAGGLVLWRVSSDAAGSRRSVFDRPAETVGFADAAFGGPGGVMEYSFVEPRFWPDFGGGFRPDPSVHFRHVGGVANVAWLDGSVSQESRTKSHWSGIYRTDSRAAGIGWFGEEDSNALFDYE